jgi:hypothetical protein
MKNQPMQFRSAVILLAACVHPLWAQLPVTTSSSRVPLGTPIGFSAQASDTGTTWYRDRVHRLGDDFQMIRDFGPRQDLLWAATGHEGTYEMEVTRNLSTGDATVQYVHFEVAPLAFDSPVITPTRHPLVFLYSAPACGAGSRIRVEIRAPNGDSQSTPYKACRPTLCSGECSPIRLIRCNTRLTLNPPSSSVRL